MFLVDYSSKYVLQKYSLGRKKKRIYLLASHLGILDDEFEDLLDAGKLSKVWSWYKKLGMHVKTHGYHYITWVAFDGSCAPLQWAHLTRH